jgi:hypothetical protein
MNIDWSAKPSAHRVELDMGKCHRLAGNRLKPSRPPGEFAQLVNQRVPAVRGLFERAARQAPWARPPGPGRIAADLTSLDLDHHDPVVRISDDHVGLAFAHVAVLAKDPAEVRENCHARRQDGAQSLDDKLLCDRARSLD